MCVAERRPCLGFVAHLSQLVRIAGILYYVSDFSYSFYYTICFPTVEERGIKCSDPQFAVHLCTGCESPLPEMSHLKNLKGKVLSAVWSSWQFPPVCQGRTLGLSGGRGPPNGLGLLIKGDYRTDNEENIGNRNHKRCCSKSL